MAKRRYVNTVFWDDVYVSDLDPSEKLVFIYLITNSCTNIAGVYQIPLKRIALDTGIDRDMIRKILDRFQADGKILYTDDGWISVKNFMKHQNYKSHLVATGIEECIQNAPDGHKTFLLYGIDTVLKEHISISQDISQDKSKSGNGKFSAPSPQAVQEYLDSLKERNFTGQAFCDFYEARGWMIGKNKMKDWKAAVRTWRNRGAEKKTWGPMQ